MFEKRDARNQKTLDEHNRVEKPLITQAAVRVLVWPAYAAIAVILLGVVVLVGYQALS